MGEKFIIEVIIDPRRSLPGAKKVRGELDRMEGKARKVGSAFRSAFGVLAAGALVASATRTLAGFSQEMSTVAAVANATGAEFDRLQAKAIELGTNTRFTATQAAEGMTFLARAGFDAGEALDAIEGTLNLAQSGALGLGEAADIASNVLKGMRLEVEETARVVDVLSLSANSSNTTVSQLGDALKLVAPIAAGLNISFEETTAAISSLSDAGLQATLAGTGLRRVLSTLEQGGPKLSKALAGTGVTLADVKVSSVGLSAALESISRAGLDTGAALEIFGQRGGPAFEILRTSIPDVIAMTAALENADGTAARIAATMDDNLNGSILALRSSIEGFVLAFGESGATGTLRSFFDAVTIGVRFAAQNIDVFSTTVVILATATLPVLIAAITALIAKSAILQGVFSAGFFSPVIVAAGLAAAAVLKFTTEMEKAAEASLKAVEAGEKFALTDFAKVGSNIIRVQENLARVQEEIDRDVTTKGFANPTAIALAKRYEDQLEKLGVKQRLLADGTSKTNAEAEKQIEAMDGLAVSVQGVLDSIEQENVLLGKNSREREVQSALLQEIADLERESKAEVTGPQKKELELALRRNQALAEQAAAFDAIRGPQEKFNAQVAALNALEEQGRIDSDELEAALLSLAAAADGVDLSRIGEIGGEDAIVRLKEQLDATRALAQEESRRARLIAEIQGPLEGLKQKELDIIAAQESGAISSDQAAAAIERNKEAIRLLNPEYAAQVELLKRLEEPNLKLQEDLAFLDAQLQANLISEQAYKQGLVDIGIATETAGTASSGFATGLQNAKDRMTDVEGAAQSLAENGFQAAEDALVEFATTGKVDFAAFAKSIIADLTRLIIKQLIFKALFGGAPGAGALPDNVAGPPVSGVRAGGGPVDPSGQFLVGEQGPELFTPDTAGNITPAGETAAIMSQMQQPAPIVNVAPPAININNIVEGDSPEDFEDSVMNTIQRKRRSVQGILG